MNQIKLILSNKWFWIVLVIIIIIIVVVYQYRNRYIRAKDVQLPPDIQTGNVTTFNPGQYTDAIFEDVDETFGVHETAPYRNALLLSNSQLVAIYNDWNQRYRKRFDNKDIIAAIEGEFTIWNRDWSLVAGQFVDRMKLLVPNRQ